jgi:hypothetical protein
VYNVVLHRPCETRDKDVRSRARIGTLRIVCVVQWQPGTREQQDTVRRIACVATYLCKLEQNKKVAKRPFMHDDGGKHYVDVDRSFE